MLNRIGKSEHSSIQLEKVAGNARRPRPNAARRAGVRIEMRTETTRLSPAETSKFLLECKAVSADEVEVPLISFEKITLSLSKGVLILRIDLFSNKQTR